MAEVIVLAVLISIVQKAGVMAQPNIKVFFVSHMQNLTNELFNQDKCKKIAAERQMWKKIQEKYI